LAVQAIAGGVLTLPRRGLADRREHRQAAAGAAAEATASIDPMAIFANEAATWFRKLLIREKSGRRASCLITQRSLLVMLVSPALSTMAET